MSGVKEQTRRTDAPRTVILFHTSSHAFRAEKLLKEADIACSLVPVPRHLSSDCGVCLRLPARDAGRARAILDARGVEIAGIHELG